MTQQTFPLIGLVPRTKDAPDDLLRRCRTEAQAVAVSVRASGLKQAYIAGALHLSESYLSRLRKGRRAFPERLVDAFCRVTGTNLLRQFRDLQDALAVAKHDDAAEIRTMAAELRRANG